MKKYRCDLCDKAFEYKEYYIAYAGKKGTRVNFCLQCTSKNPDDKKRKGVNWFYLEHGIADISHN